jgi:hypothetical protein
MPSQKILKTSEPQLRILFLNFTSIPSIEGWCDGDHLEMESPGRYEVVLGCSVAGVVSWLHGIWRTAGAFQDCKDRDFSLN